MLCSAPWWMKNRNRNRCSVKHFLRNLSTDSAPEIFHSEMEMFQTKITRLEAPLTQASSLTIIGSRML